METKSQEWIEQTEAKIREVFDLFDKDKADAIIQEEVGTVMRALGVYPTGIFYRTLLNYLIYLIFSLKRKIACKN